MIENLQRIDYSKKFLKQLKKAPLEIKIAYRRRFAMFLDDPFHPLLDNHALAGDWLGYRSINITGDWRVIFKEYLTEIGKTVIIFHIIGTHSQIYR